MKRTIVLLAFLLASACGVKATTCNGHTVPTTSANICINEANGTTQLSRPITHGYAFADDGSFPAGKCPQPVIEGTPAASWQADVKQRWPSGNLKFAVISYVVPSLSSGGADNVTFQQSSTCNNTGFLTATGMANFNVGGGAGVWDATIVVAALGSTTVTVSAKTMLTASDPGTHTYGDCGNNYWLQGTVVTAVIVQDCTSAMSFDFGWHWNGATMSSPVTGTASTASFHPMFILYFYPGTNDIYVEAIYEIPWWGKRQDQMADVTFQTSNSSGVLTTRFSHVGTRILNDVTTVGTNNNPPVEPFISLTSASANFVSTDNNVPACTTSGGFWYCGRLTVTSSTQATMTLPNDGGPPANGTNQPLYINVQAASTRHRKAFWVGAQPAAGSGQNPGVRLGYNFPYLISSRFIPNFDLVTANTPNPDHGYYASGKCCGAWKYADWASNTDHGDIGGFAGWEAGFNAVTEGTPLFEDDVRYLYNMDSTSCGSPNSACAKAWTMMTGEIDANASTTLVGCAGGCGNWNNLGNVPFHIRESQTSATGGNQTSGNCFYVSAFENKNAAGNATASTCTGAGDGLVADPTGPNNATGKALSRHAHSDTGEFGTSVGNVQAEPGGWGMNECSLHWRDYDYLAYVLTGSPYYLEEQYMSASFNMFDFHGPALNTNFTTGGFFGYMNPGGLLVRGLAWGLQSIVHASFIAPDGSAEQAYYTAIANSNLEVQEGVMNLTGTTLSPTDTSCGGANTSCTYNVNSPNRFNWGAATVRSQCVNTVTATCTIIPQKLHNAAPGGCPVDGSNDVMGTDWTTGLTYSTGDVVAYPAAGPTQSSNTYYKSLVNSNLNNQPNTSPSDWVLVSASNAVVSTADGISYHYSFLTIVLAEMREMGYPAAATSTDTLKSYVERILDSNYNPFLIQEAYLGTHDITGNTNCTAGNSGGENSDQYLSTYVQLKSATMASERSANTFDQSGTPLYTNFACGPGSDHSYSTIARAALSFAVEFGVTSIDSGTSATLTAQNAWNWAVAHIPYYNLSVSGSTACSVFDTVYLTATDNQEKFAFVPRQASVANTIPVPAPIFIWNGKENRQ